MGITTKGAENSAFFKISLKKVVMIHPGIKKARGIECRLWCMSVPDPTGFDMVSSCTFVLFSSESVWNFLFQWMSKMLYILNLTLLVSFGELCLNHILF